MMLAVASHALIPEVCCKLATYEQLIHQKMNLTNVAIEFLRIPKDGQHTTRILSLITPHHVPFYMRGREEVPQRFSKTVCDRLLAVCCYFVDCGQNLVSPLSKSLSHRPLLQKDFCKRTKFSSTYTHRVWDRPHMPKTGEKHSHLANLTLI